MRAAIWASIVAIGFTTQALAQQPSKKATAAQAATKTEPKSKAKTKTAPTEKKQRPAKTDASAVEPQPPSTAAQKEAYAKLPISERIAIQSELVWTGDLTGGLDPNFGDRAIAAVKAFQRRNKFDDTGLLTAEQRQTLATATRSRREYHGWQSVEDSVTPGVRLGIPAKLVPLSETGVTGSRWSSARGEIQIETFREKMAGSTLPDLYEEMKRRPSSRRVEYQALQANNFALSGLQGLKRFHVRVFLKENEARGITILFDQAMEGIMLPLVDTIANSYLPFGDAASSSAWRKVEYGSGIVVSETGHVVTQRDLTDKCHGLIVAGLGRAERVAEDENTHLALLKINGARKLSPLPMSNKPPKSGALVLHGVPVPLAQAGDSKVHSTAAKLQGVEGSRVLLDIVPSSGFIGGAALDGDGNFVGMVEMPGSPDNGSLSAPSAAALIPSATILNFLNKAEVDVSGARGKPADASQSIVRIICVRK
jgi:S1-C subfamily serine protease/peptidoglycan hydrolase-like protein with peptidoglycan-binding domain